MPFIIRERAGGYFKGITARGVRWTPTRSDAVTFDTKEQADAVLDQFGIAFCKVEDFDAFPAPHSSKER